ncbi:MAG: Lrp/AsnC family transcriptional regulator [Candidatus Bathyarchaeia archaeon]
MFNHEKSFIIKPKEETLLKIKELDSEILKSLLRDGRTGYNEIADRCGVSKNKVWKRYKAMEKRGIVNGATVQINFGSFGFDALVTLLISVEPQQLEQVMELIGKITEVRAYRQYDSVYNIRAVATLRNLNELDHVKQLIKRKLPTTGLKTYIWTGVRNMPENLNFTGNRRNTSETDGTYAGPVACAPGERIMIDELDKQIVDKLTVNGRVSFSKIARELGLSTDTVVKRYHRLKEKGAIKISIQINPSKIGYTSILDFNIAFTTPGSVSSPLVESLAKIQNVIIITKTSGDYDLQLSAMVRDMEESFDIQDEIARISGITKIEAGARKIPERWPTPMQYVSNF